MRRSFALLAFALVGVYSSSSWSAGYARLGLSYISRTTGSESNPTEAKRTLMDFGVGYVWTQGWTLGALYATEDQTTGSTKVSRTAMGPTFGWMERNRGPYVLATYFLSVERDDDYSGTGYQIDFGYKFSIGSVSFAPQIAYKKITYDELDGAELATKQVDDSIDPYFAFWYEF